MNPNHAVKEFVIWQGKKYTPEEMELIHPPLGVILAKKFPELDAHNFDLKKELDKMTTRERIADATYSRYSKLGY